jgi:hypothetical protein
MKENAEGWVGDKMNTRTAVMAKLSAKRLIARPRRSCEVSIKMELGSKDLR